MPEAKNSEKKTGEIVKCFQAVADKYRFRILRMLEVGPLSLQMIQQVLDVRLSDLKKHLRILKAACLISEFKNGAQVFYCIKPKPDKRHFCFQMLSLVRQWQNWNPLIKRDKVKVLSIDEK